MRDEPLDPADKAARWISHVTRFGGGHLRPQVQDMNFIQSNLIDVYGFIICLSLVVIFTAKNTSLCCYRRCRKLYEAEKMRKIKQN